MQLKSRERDRVLVHGVSKCDLVLSDTFDDQVTVHVSAMGLDLNRALILQQCAEVLSEGGFFDVVLVMRIKQRARA